MSAPSSQEPPAAAVAALAAAPLFAALDAAILRALARSAARSAYAAREVVFLAGEADDGLYVVESGWLKAVKIAASGREQTVATFGPGATLNSIAVLAGAPTQTTLIGLEPTVLWRIPRAAVAAQIEVYPALAQAIIGSLANRVLHLSALVEDLAFRSVEARLARLILAQARDGQIERRRWATQAELAAQVGTVPDVLNRALRTLVDAGLIAVDRRSIRVVDPAGLERRAEIG